MYDKLNFRCLNAHAGAGLFLIILKSMAPIGPFDNFVFIKMSINQTISLFLPLTYLGLSSALHQSNYLYNVGCLQAIM